MSCLHEEDKINTMSGVSQMKKPLRICFDESEARLDTRSFCYRERSRRKPSGLCKIRRRTGYGMTSLETIVKTEACNPEAPSLIGRKSLKSWLTDRDDPFESGDSGEIIPCCSEV